jgi:preprotein translocase subunit SecG
MQSVLIVIHLLVVIALVAVVLLQRSEGGALGAGGGGGFMTGRGQANALSRATAILGGLFFASALAMSILAGWNRAPRSILDTNAPSNKASTDSTKPAGSGNLLDQLKSMSEKPAESPAPSAPAPAAPPAPAPAAPAPAPAAPK